MTRLRIGVLGLSHDHVWSNLAALATGDLGQLVAAADPDPRLRERLEKAYGGVTALAAYDALLERRDLITPSWSSPTTGPRPSSACARCSGDWR